MQSFRIRPGGYKEIRKKLLFIMVPIFLVVMSIVCVTSVINISGTSKTIYHPVSTYDLILALTAFVIPFGVAGFVIYRVLVRIKKMYESYELQISDNLIAREVFNTPTVSIYLKDVQEIVKRKNGTFIVRGSKNYDVFFIPKQIENYDQVETALEQIMPVTTKSKKNNLQIVQLILNFILIGLLICVNTVNNKIIVATAGILFLGIMIWNFIQTQKSKNVDYRTKRFRWFSLILAIAIIYIAIQKLFSPETP